MESTKIKEICGIQPNNFVPASPTDNNFIFENDLNFPALNLYDFFGRGATVNSYQECAHYVQGGWEPFKTTIFDYLLIFGVAVILVVFFILNKKFSLLKKVKKFNLLSSVKERFKNKTIINFSLFTFVLFQHFFIFDYVRTKSVSITSFIDEYVVLTSNVNFYKNLDFNAGEFLGGSYSVYLTSGPISAIGSVISWNITNNFILGRISNFYWLLILQLIFSVFLFKLHRKDFRLLIAFNGLILLSIPWWQGGLYSLGEIASMIIFTNSMFLFHKFRKFSMILFSISIFFGKILTLLPFFGFYGAQLLIKRNLRKTLFEITYFLIPLAVWLVLVELNYESGNAIQYFKDQYYLIINHSGSGVSTLNTSQFFNIEQNIFQTEIINWSIYDRIRLSLTPIITIYIIYINREKINMVYDNLSFPLIFSIFVPYLWFWLINSNKWIRYSQHFSVVVLIVLLYLLFSNINLDKSSYFITTSMLAFFIENSKFLIGVLVITALFLIVKLDTKILNRAISILFIVVFTIDISLPYFEKDTLSNLNNSIEECIETLVSSECVDAYMRKLSR